MLRMDDLENGYVIRQDPDAFCFGIDAVLLAHYPDIRKRDRVLDLCTGFAPIPHILAARARDKGYFANENGPHITGVEIQEEIAAAARQSAADNGLTGRIDIVTMDLREAVPYFGAASFSLITCNPPYLPKGSGKTSDNPVRAIARTEIACTLADVVSISGKLLKESGRLALVHRPQRLSELFVLLSAARLMPKRMRLVQPHAGEAPNLVLVEAVKGAKAGLVVEPPLVVYDREGKYTAEVKEIYGRGESG